MRFMLETMVALRTNNPRKIPHYDPSQVEHMTKFLRTLLPPGGRVRVGLHGECDICPPLTPVHCWSLSALPSLLFTAGPCLPSPHSCSLLVLVCPPLTPVHCWSLSALPSLLFTAGLCLPSPHTCSLLVLVCPPLTPAHCWSLSALPSLLLTAGPASSGSLTEARLKISLHDLINTDKQGVVFVECPV